VDDLKKEVSRRNVLKADGIGVAGLLVGASGAGSLLAFKASADQKESAVAAIAEGKEIGKPASNVLMPPDDTLEASGLDASNITIKTGQKQTPENSHTALANGDGSMKLCAALTRMRTDLI
jgi:deferrochelatase/peroxidase EfeB